MAKIAVPTKAIYPLKTLGKEVTAAYSGREFNYANRGAFFEGLKIKAANVVELKQVHSANLVFVSKDKVPDANCSADGMMTTVPGMVLVIRTADCIPVFFHDPQNRVIGIAHAGWRGVHHNIAGKMILAFKQNFRSNPADIKIALGPGIRKESYEVGSEFKELFGEFYKDLGPADDPNSKGRLDLVGVIRSQVLAEGANAKNIHDTGICSFRDKRFYSYRREKGTAERTLSAICLRNSAK